MQSSCSLQLSQEDSFPRIPDACGMETAQLGIVPKPGWAKALAQELGEDKGCQLCLGCQISSSQEGLRRYKHPGCSQ